MADDRSRVAETLSTLIRFDTTNPGQPERPAAEWLAARLDGIGVASRIVEASPGRASLLARVEGADASRPPLLLHGHLDVVPADPEGWTHHPFSGEIADGWVWGRGAIDMKDLIAMLLELLERWHERGQRPARDLVLAFVADEEAGGRSGSHFVVDHHSDVLRDCEEAVGEVGGFSVALSADTRAYLIETGEKGLAWTRLRASGAGGHGSMLHEDNPISALAAGLARVCEQVGAPVQSQTMTAFTARLGAALGVDLDPADPDAWVDRLGSARRMIGAAFRNTVNPTVVSAGTVPNTVPRVAEAMIDLRWVPGEEEAFMARVAEALGPRVEMEPIVRAPSLESPVDAPLVVAMEAALAAEDEGAVPLPYLMSGGTDAKAFTRLGLRCYGFAPLLLPHDLDFTALFHGVDERVPIASLEFGTRVLDRLLQAY